MGKKEFLARLGFSEDPFQSTNVDEEEHLQSYFIPPPYFDSVWGNPEIPQSQVIFALRGGGKSAQRRMIEFHAEKENVFAITYDRFEHLSGLKLRTLGTEYHLKNLIQIGLLGFFLEVKARSLMIPSFSSTERETIDALAQLYLGKITKLKVVDTIKGLKTLSSKAKQVISEWSGPMSALVSTVLSTQGLPSVSMGTIAAGTNRTGNLEGPTKVHLEILRDLIKSVGFTALYILVDKVDEAPETSNRAEESFLLLKSLLCDLELLQSKGLGFKFFLWDKLEPYYREFARPDRVQQFTLSWRETELNTMLSRRLSAFSNERVKDLRQLTDAALADPLQLLVVLFANGSPRDMIRICQYILSEQLQLDTDSEKIGIAAIEQGIGKFAGQRTRELIP
jgi:hypothetical protein